MKPKKRTPRDKAECVLKRISEYPLDEHPTESAYAMQKMAQRFFQSAGRRAKR